MKIIEWNIRQGGGTRINNISDSIRNYDADYYVLTEYRNNRNGLELIDTFAKNGYCYHFAVQADKNKNTVLIASKYDFSATLFHEELGDGYSSVIRIENEELVLYGTYFPQKNEKAKIFEFLIKEMAIENSKPTIFIGDFNTGRPFIDETKNTFYCSKYMDAIEQQGYIDAWRHIHQDKREFTWYSNRGNGFRIDHTFIHSSYKNKIIRCDYSHDVRTNKFSDHSMMEIEIANT